MTKSASGKTAAGSTSNKSKTKGAAATTQAAPAATIAAQASITHVHTNNTRGYQHNLEKRERVKEELESSEMTQVVCLPHCGLLQIPDAFWMKDELIPKLRKLDLSHNHLTYLPSEIKWLSNLRELWVSYNPISNFPQEIVTLKKLTVIDIRHTNISNLPTEVVDLVNLIEFDWRETPLEKILFEEHKIPVNALTTLQVVFRNINIRKKSKDVLFAYLFGEHYIMDADKSYAKDVIATFVDHITDVFEDLDDYVSFSKRPGTFVPHKVDDITRPFEQAKKAKALFYELKRETDRKRLAADVEIKLRGMYFDRIERSEVTSLIDSIYANVESLEDMQFFVQYAVQVLPPTVAEASGEKIWQNILDLQDDLIQKREASIMALANALNQLYPEQKPESLQVTAREIARFFQKERFATKKELLRMTQLTADVTKVFPPDYASIVPNEVVQAAFDQIFKKL